jgi:hypothetical protein
LSKSELEAFPWLNMPHKMYGNSVNFAEGTPKTVQDQKEASTMPKTTNRVIIANIVKALWHRQS